MSFSKISPWIFTAFAMQASMILYFENSYLKRENRICHAAGDLLRDQISDLNASVSELIFERDYTATKNYILGATQAANEPQKFGEIWHDGYIQGMNQTKYVSDHLHPSQAPQD